MPVAKACTLADCTFSLQGDARQEEQDAEDRERFLLADSEILLHHASETLLRLYLAHEQLPPPMTRLITTMFTKTSRTTAPVAENASLVKSS